MKRETSMALGRLTERAAAIVAGAWPVPPPAAADVERLLGSADEETDGALGAAARRARDSGLGPRLVARALVEISSRCCNGCRYCGLNAGNGRARRYSLSADEILESAARAFRAGLRTVVLQSGEDGRDAAELSEIIRAVKRAGYRADLADGERRPAVTLSLGERPEPDYAAWKEAGADRYLMRMETGDRELYAALHDGRVLDSRLACHDALRRLGYQLGSGVLVGLPGQGAASVARDIAAMAGGRYAMLGIGPFIPHPDTPLGGAAPGDVRLALRATALARLCSPWSWIPATTAMASQDRDYRVDALLRGANVVMPNFSPAYARDAYAIYPGKRCSAEADDEQRPERTIDSLGRLAEAAGLAVDLGRADGAWPT